MQVTPQTRRAAVLGAVVSWVAMWAYLEGRPERIGVTLVEVGAALVAVSTLLRMAAAPGERLRVWRAACLVGASWSALWAAAGFAADRWLGSAHTVAFPQAGLVYGAAAGLTYVCLGVGFGVVMARNPLRRLAIGGLAAAAVALVALLASITQGPVDIDLVSSVEGIALVAAIGSISGALTPVSTSDGQRALENLVTD